MSGYREVIVKGIVGFSSVAFLSSLPLIGYSAQIPTVSGVRVGHVFVPPTFAGALRSGMSIPLFLHLEGNTGIDSDQRLGNAFIWLEGDGLKLRRIQREENEHVATLLPTVVSQLTTLKDVDFNDRLRIELDDEVWLQFDFKKLILQLVVRKSALGTAHIARSKDIGESSVTSLSSTLDYNLGVYNNRPRHGENTTSSYLSLNNVTALREHHVVVNGSLYGLGGSDRSGTLYKVMYERDFGGYRFATGMLDSWNLQSLGPLTGMTSAKVYGFSLGNQADSTVFDNSQSATPIVAFFPAAGEAHIKRDGRLLSVQAFEMGNHELDTHTLPYGIYDVEVDVVINGKTAERRVQRVNKLFTAGRGANAPLGWQFWGGSVDMDAWHRERGGEQSARKSWLAGVSASGNWWPIGWAATGYGYDNMALVEARITLPVTERVTFNLQSMAASDSSWRNVMNMSATLPGGFSSIWVNQERSAIGDRLRQSSSHNRSIGGTLNFSSLWSPLGSLSVSYSDDRKNGSRYYTTNYQQNIYTGRYGSIGLRLGMQRYSNNGYSSSTGKYVALDLSLPLGSWFSAGVSSQNGYTLANLAVRKNFSDGAIRSAGANLSRAISGNTGPDNTLSGGGWAQFDTRYANGTLNVATTADGSLNSNMTASGSLGWQGKHIALSGRNDGNAGIIFETGLEDSGLLSAKVNGQAVTLKGKRSYIPVSPYGHYDVELLNNPDSFESYDIVGGRRNRLTLYPGNVAVITPEIKQMVTVFGRLHAEDGSLLTDAAVNNHIGRTRTDGEGAFVMDIDKAFPTIDFSGKGDERCEAQLDLSAARGAVWVGDVICLGLPSYASNLDEKGNRHEG